MQRAYSSGFPQALSLHWSLTQFTPSTQEFRNCDAGFACTGDRADGRPCNMLLLPTFESESNNLLPCMFTPSPVDALGEDIGPSNIGERIFAAGVVIFALIASRHRATNCVKWLCRSHFPPALLFAMNLKGSLVLETDPRHHRAGDVVPQFFPSHKGHPTCPHGRLSAQRLLEVRCNQ